MNDKVKIIETEDGIELVSTDFEALHEEKLNHIGQFTMKRGNIGNVITKAKYEVLKSWAVNIKGGIVNTNGTKILQEPRIEFHILLKKL